ncbi:MAG: cupredoxin domain-containing protein [Nanoarchaeota archaeon]|nr:cupredoxin domain-containing protein [Nanoarchaeota archaeon]
MKNRHSITIISVILMVLLIIILFFIINFYGKTTTANSVNIAASQQDIKSSLNIQNNTNLEVQRIVLSFRENYSPDTIKVKAGVPVEITLDESVTGCYRSFIVEGLEISLYSKNPLDLIKFTPEKKGTFKFSCCSSNMGTGNIIVE